MLDYVDCLLSGRAWYVADNFAIFIKMHLLETLIEGPKFKFPILSV